MTEFLRLDFVINPRLSLKLYHYLSSRLRIAGLLEAVVGRLRNGQCLGLFHFSLPHPALVQTGRASFAVFGWSFLLTGGRVEFSDTKLIACSILFLHLHGNVPIIVFKCRLLLYHVVAEYDPEELELSPAGAQSGATSLLISRAQSWNDTLKAKTAEYVGALEKHISTYNSILKRRAGGDMCGEERLLVEKYLLVDERQKLADARAKIEAKERAERVAHEARIKEALAQVEEARAEAQAQAEAARAKALVEAEAAQPAESSQKSNQAFLPEIGVDSDALQPPINGEGLGDLEGWYSSEGEEEYEEGQPGKEDDDEEDEDDNPDSLFAEGDGAENAYEGMNEGVTSTQNELADEDILHFNPRECM